MDANPAPARGGDPAPSPRLTAVDGGLGPGAVKSAERSVRLLEVLAATDAPMGMPALQAATGIPKSSLHVLLRTLSDLGWVEGSATGAGFGIGPRALICGTAYLDGDPALPHGVAAIEAVRAEVGYTAHYGRLLGDDVLYLATREASKPRRLVHRVGRCLPAQLTALGLALLADRTDEEVAAILPPRWEPLTTRSRSTRAEVVAALETVRGEGHAVEREQNTLGICCVARAVEYRIPASDSLSCSIPLDLASDREVRHVADVLERHAAALARTLRRDGVR